MYHEVPFFRFGVRFPPTSEKIKVDGAVFCQVKITLKTAPVIYLIPLVKVEQESTDYQ